MSRRSERILKLVELAQRRADLAARRLGEHQQRQRQAGTVREELANFRSLYGEQRSRPGQVMTAGALWNSHQFLGRIDDALGQQQQDLERQARQAEQLRQQWLAARQRADALKLVASQLEKADTQRQQNSEQQLADEMSSLRFGRPSHD